MDIRDQVVEVIELMRPAIQADGGDIVLRDVDESTGVVSVELPGGCRTCASVALNSLEAGVGRILRDRIPGVTAVMRVECAEDAASCRHA